MARASVELGDARAAVCWRWLTGVEIVIVLKLKSVLTSNYNIQSLILNTSALQGLSRNIANLNFIKTNSVYEPALSVLGIEAQHYVFPLIDIYITSVMFPLYILRTMLKYL